MMVPSLIDPNTGTVRFASVDVVAHLEAT